MKLRRLLASAGVALAVFLGRLPDARALVVFFEDSRIAEGGGALSGGGSGAVVLVTGDELVAATSASVSPQFLFAAVDVCSTSGCDGGSIFTDTGGTLTTPGVGPLWMDPLLMQASFTITVPSSTFIGGTLTATVTMTGTGPYSPGLPIPVISPGPPAELAGGADLERGGTIAGMVSSTALGFSGTFATGDSAFLVEFASGFVTAP